MKYKKNCAREVCSLQSVVVFMGGCFLRFSTCHPMLFISGDPDKVNHSRQSVSRFVRWLTKDENACPGKYQKAVRYICLIGVELLPNATRSMALFANKLDIKLQPIALECLHDWIWDRVVKEYQNPDASYFDVSYYRNLDFVQKHVTANEYIWLYIPVTRDNLWYHFRV